VVEIYNILRNLITQTKKIKNEILPSQGLFYPDDFSIRIKKAEVEDIIEYELNFDKDNLVSVIECIKSIVRKNVILNGDWSYEDIKSIDTIFIFLEIVKYTNNKEITINVTSDDSKKTPNDVIFGSQTFNYFDFSPYVFKDNQILLNDYMYSLPSNGIEESLNSFFKKKIEENDVDKWLNYNHDFIFFCGNKRNLTHEEIENLILIFNNDIDDSEKENINKIVNTFSKVINYSFKVKSKTFNIKNKIDLKNIWR